MGCTRRIASRLSVYVEEFISPLTVIARSIKDLFSNRKEVCKTVVATTKTLVTAETTKNILNGFSEITRMPSLFPVIYNSKNTRNVIFETLKSNFIYTAAPVLLSEMYLKPFLQTYFPSVGETLYWYARILLARESLRRLFVYSPIYNMCVPQALNKDLELMIQEDITQVLKDTYSTQINKFLLDPMLPKDVLRAARFFLKKFYHQLAIDITKATIKAFSNSSVIEDVYDIKKNNPDVRYIFFAALGDGLAEILNKTKLDEIAKTAVSQFFSSLNLRKRTAKKMIKNEEYLRCLFKTNLDELVHIVLKVPLADVTNNICTYLHSEEANSKTLFPLLPSQHFYAKSHSLTEMIYTRFMSPFYYLAGVRAQYFLSGMLGPVAGKAFDALLTGFLLLDLKFSSVGMPRKQRFEIISKNKGYTFGLGAAVVALTDLSVLAVNNFSGVTSWQIPLAIYYPIFQAFSILTLLKNDPLPGKGEGFDLFYFTRLEAEHSVRKTADYLVPKLRDKTFRDEVWNTVNHPIVLNARLLFMGGKLKSLESLVKIPAFNLFLKLYGRDIVQTIEELRSSRVPKLTRSVLWVLYFFSSIFSSKYATEIISVLQNDKMSFAINKFHQLVSLAERRKEDIDLLEAKKNEGFVEIAKELKKTEIDKKPADEKSTLPEVKQEVLLLEAPKPDGLSEIERAIREDYFTSQPGKPIPKVEQEEDDYVKVNLRNRFFSEIELKPLPAKNTAAPPSLNRRIV